MLQKLRFFDKKKQNYRYQNYCPGWQYSNLFIWPSMWTRLEHAHCLETIHNMWFLGKEKLPTSGRKRTLTDSERKMNRSEVSFKWNKCRIDVGISWTVGTNSRKCYASKLALNLQIFCLIGKPNMFFPSFLNRFSYFINLWSCPWSFSADIIQYM
jgi:hypothetical protein